MNRSLSALAAIFVIAAAAAFFLQTQQGNGPPAGGMVPQDTSNIAKGAPLADVKVPATFSAAAQLGERAFNAKCAVCHGKNAAGQNGVAPPFVNQIYRPGHHGDVAFQLAVKNGVRSHHWRFGNMPPQQGLTQADVKNIVAYIRELQRENGIF
jgi:mono/diheme cytochrome c family protein